MVSWTILVLPAAFDTSLPKDLWSVKGIINSGLDSGVYRDKIKALWGKYPLDTYIGTEGGIIATQTWNCDGMTPFKRLLNNFWYECSYYLSLNGREKLSLTHRTDV